MEEIKPKKERKFLKAVGKVAGILIQEFVLGLGRKFIGKKIDRIGNKRQALLIFLALFCNIAFASIDSIPYPIIGNKQRLGWQTTGNGLVYRGRASDTITKPSNYANKDIKAYMLFDTVNNVLYSYIASKGGWKFNNSDTVIIQGVTMPFDSITFNTAKDGTVGVGEVEYNDTQGSLIQGLKGGNVTNVIGQQLHQRVNNKTGGTLAKGTVVYLSGSQGNRITVSKALATSDPTSANTFGIVAEQILDNESGYVITEGLITNINTLALTQDSAVYLSGTTAGALTSTKPQAPIHGVYIGVCVKSNAGSGELFVKIRNGQELDELHDLVISSPVDRASLYYKSSEGLWRDTTAALLVSDTASMLTNYLRTGTAASTYLPLTGGTLTGALSGTSATFSADITAGNTLSSDIKSMTAYGSNNGTSVTSSGGSRLNLYNLNGTVNTFSTLAFYNKTSNGTLYPAAQIRGIKASDHTSILSGALSFDLVDTFGNYQERLRLTNLGNFGIGTTTPSYKLDVNGTLGVTGTSSLNSNGVVLNINSINSNLNKISLQDNSSIRSYIGASSTKIFTVANSSVDEKFSISNDGNTLIGGTLGITGFSTFSTGAVINENSNDSDTRIESDGNANMVFVDASTDRVGIGTNSPSKTLDVNGELNVSSAGTFGGRLNTNWLERTFTYSTSTTLTVSVNTTWLKLNNSSTITLTLPDASTYLGKELHIKNIDIGAVNSNSSNVEAIDYGSVGTAILPAGPGKWATLVSDGTYWVKMAGN